MSNQTPFGQTQTPRDAHFTGQNLNAVAGTRTPWNANLRRGDVLQFDPFDHDNVKQASPAPAAGVADGGIYVCGIPTATFNTGICVVAEEPASPVNDIQNAGTGLRRGGRIKVVTKGLVQARCLAGISVVKGVSQLAINTATNEFVLMAVATLATIHNVVAAAGVGKCAAVAMETKVIAASPNNLCLVCLNGNAEQ